jgi:hypothetical protein
MTTITLKINERTKAGKAFMAMSESFFKNIEGLEIIETDSKKLKKVTNSELKEQNPYHPAFVKMVLDAEKSGKYTTLDPNDVWGSLGLK